MVLSQKQQLCVIAQSIIACVKASLVWEVLTVSRKQAFNYEQRRMWRDEPGVQAASAGGGGSRENDSENL